MIVYITLVLISVGIGKGIDNSKVQSILKLSTAILCAFNFFVVIYAIVGLFDTFLSYLILIIFIFTFFLPLILYDLKNSCLTLCQRQLPGMISYILCMPLYVIIFQVYSYANLNDVSWGNRDVSADITL